MRKRSKYKPRPMLLDAMAWLKSGFAPLTAHTSANVDLRLRNTAAHGAILDGTATADDLDVLIGMSNMCTALARKHGADWREEIRSAADAIEAMQKRYFKWRKVQATPAELEAITLMTQIHDAQLDAARITDLDEAIAIARKGVKGITA